MKRKNILVATAAAVSVCILGACGKDAVKDVVSAQQESSADPESTATENETDAKQSEPSASESNAADSTGKDSQEMGVDYNIDSYENLQGFGYDLFGKNIEEENPVLSPVSAYLALSMAGVGADGATAGEFRSVLGDGMEALSGNMMSALPENGELLKLSIANSAWIDDEFAVNDEWLGAVNSLMDSEAFQVDLSTKETMDSMNGWIDDKTNGMIDKMIEEPLDKLMRMVLFNTVYFKGKWKIPFEAIDTYKEDFYTDRAKNETEQVDMMNLYNKHFDYISNDFAEGVVLPYQNNGAPKREAKWAFIALKPRGDSDIRETYGKLTNTVISDALANKQTELVNLKLPKFEVTFDKALNDSLKSMGLNECFDGEKANFDLMGQSNDGYNIYISLVRQKAKVIVDEEGTEAAAVTEIEMKALNAILIEEPRNVYFDEPFIYMVMDMEREIPLFIGIMDNPAAE